MRSSFARLSLKQKLPLLICGLLLALVLLDTAASYGSVKSVSLAVGRERLSSVTDQLAELFTASVTNTEHALRAAAGDSAIARYFRARTEGNRATALAAMNKPGPAAQQRIVAELWSLDGHLVLSSAAGAARPHGDVGAELARAADAPRYLALGRLRAEHDTIVVPITAAVIDRGRPVGYYLEWRRIASTPRARDQFLRLIGPSAAMLLGNDSGSVWTDLATVAKPPAVDLRGGLDIAAYASADGTPVFGTARAIDGAPWTVLVEFPQRTVLAPAGQFLRRSAMIGLVLVVAGIIAAWMLSRAITRPLKLLTDASAAVASGSFTSGVDVARADELGQLASAFNSMAAQVRDTTLTLEERVKERTRRLERLQVVLLRTERLNSLATLGAGLAHDLNNLLFSIGLAAEQMQREAGNGSSARPELPDRITTATAEARRLTKRLMSFARGETGHVEPALVDVSAAVAAQEDLLRMLLPRTVGLRLVLDSPGRRVLMPATLIEQALVNLVSNSKDAMPSGGEVIVRVREEYLDGALCLLLEVTDTGHGVAAEIQGEIFEPFFSTKAEQGTGIGLASVRALMESVGGTVTVHSPPGQGATFRLAFSLEHAPVPRAASGAHAVPSAAQRISS